MVLFVVLELVYVLDCIKIHGSAKKFLLHLIEIVYCQAVALLTPLGLLFRGLQNAAIMLTVIRHIV